jgi:hypothetical protein
VGAGGTGSGLGDVVSDIIGLFAVLVGAEGSGGGFGFGVDLFAVLVGAGGTGSGLGDVASDRFGLFAVLVGAEGSVFVGGTGSDCAGAGGSGFVYKDSDLAVSGGVGYGGTEPISVCLTFSLLLFSILFSRAATSFCPF